jgi:hypothetical protein
MKALIAVVNANHRTEWRDVIRDTWLKHVPADKADVVFFTGRGEERARQQDEIELPCDDSYAGLPEKIREIARWFKERSSLYHRFLKCDDDVVLHPEMLLASDYNQHEYVGRANRVPTPTVPCWVPMGFNYWVSQKSVLISS